MMSQMLWILLLGLLGWGLMGYYYPLHWWPEARFSGELFATGVSVGAGSYVVKCFKLVYALGMPLEPWTFFIPAGLAFLAAVLGNELAHWHNRRCRCT